MSEQMSKEDFTEDELILLRSIFKGAEEMLYVLRDRLWSIDMNDLYNLKQKLGIYDLVD